MRAGQHASLETRMKISKALKGKKKACWKYGMPELEKLKRSLALKGRPHNKDWNAKVAHALTGRARSPFNEEWKKKIGEASKKRWLEGKFDNRDISFHNIEWRENHSKQMKGLNNPNWQGGINPLYATIRNSNEYKNWRKQVFERDNYTCQDCGKPSNGNIEAHHIKPFSQILDEFNIKSFEQALNCVELWDINNGVTLCELCHEKIDVRLKRLQRRKENQNIISLVPQYQYQN